MGEVGEVGGGEEGGGGGEEEGRKEVVTLAIYTIVIQVMRLCGTSKNAVLQKAVNFHSALPTVY